MPSDLLREICIRTHLLQMAHKKHFKGFLTGKNTKNLNFWICYCIKLYDSREGTSLLKEWKYFIKLSTQKLDEYNKTLREQLVILGAFYGNWYNRVDQISERVKWPYVKIYEADIFVPPKLRYK
jgi:hypothetical protein